MGRSFSYIAIQSSGLLSEMDGEGLRTNHTAEQSFFFHTDAHNFILVLNTFLSFYQVIIQYQEKDGKGIDSSASTATTAKMSVGKYFTIKGEFDEVRL